MDGDKIRIEYVPLSELQRWPGNPKRHDIMDLDKSFERFGFVQPLTVDEATGKLVAGHGRLEALSALKAVGKDPPARVEVREDGEWLLPVVRGVSFATEHEAEAYLLADNRIAERGGWDQDLLADMVSRMTSDEDMAAAFAATASELESMAGTGFDNDEVRSLLERAAARDPANKQFKEFDESAANDVEMIECPNCQHKWPK